MNEHTKLIVELRTIRYGFDKQGDATHANAIGDAIAALRRIQSKTDEPKIDADTTLRNQFAGLAMQGLIDRDDGDCSDLIAERSFHIARAMIEESKKHT